LQYRHVAQCGGQVPGKYFTDYHFPKRTDQAFKVSLIIRILKKLQTGPFYIYTYFLDFDMEEEIYIKIPEGYPIFILELYNIYSSDGTRVLLIKKATDHLVQAPK
jgi:hypothetical protein